MENILTLKVQLQNMYASYSKIVDKIVRFILAFVTFFTLSSNIGFMHSLTNPIITFGLSVICAFMPTGFTVLAAAALTVGHVYSVSMGMAIIVAAIFVLMFIFYVRMAPNTAVSVLLVPVAFMLKIPAAVPVAFALVFSPVYAVSVGLGTIAYYMIKIVKSAVGANATDASGFVSEMMDFSKVVFTNKEMWAMTIAGVLCVLVVFGLRKTGVNHAWKIASFVGGAVYAIVAIAGSMVFSYKVSTTILVAGVVASIVVGLVLEIIFFSVDYSKCETLEYEDDEYYYYVKAVPKVGVSAPKKTVKEINKRGALREEAEVIDVEDLHKKPRKNRPERKKPRDVKKGKKPVREPEPQSNRIKSRRPVAVEDALDDTDELLLTESLRKDLELDDN